MVYAVIVTAIILFLTNFFISTTYCTPEVLYGVRCNSNCQNFVARETDFSPSFTPELALRPRHAYQFNPLVRRNSDLVRD